MKFLSFQLLFLSSLLLLIGIACTDQTPQTKWYKGNLHTHSYWSDGDEFPERIMEWYKKNGYQFVALSEHNIMAKGNKSIQIALGSMHHEAFDEYLKKYGEQWVKHSIDSGRVSVKLKTLAEYAPLFEEKEKFLILPAEEITDQFDGKPLHLNATNLQELIPPQGGNSVLQVLQNNINAVLQQRAETGIPMIVHINHPNFHYAISVEEMMELTGERFFEVFNGHPSVYNFGDSAHISTEEMWDMINIAYIKKGQPLMYGIATDDSHHYHLFGKKWSNSGRGWVMVNATELSAPTLIDALENGNFYASSGVTLKDLQFEDGKLQLEIAAEEGVNYEIAFIGCKAGAQQSEVLAKVNDHAATFDVTEEYLFVRAKITSDKPMAQPIEEANFEAAWTQPVFVLLQTDINHLNKK